MTATHCPDCNGTGEYVHPFADGTGAVSQCPTCSTTGRGKEVSDRKQLPTVERCDGCRFGYCKLILDANRVWRPEGSEPMTLEEYEEEEESHICRRFPQTVEKYHDDWCGEFALPPVPSAGAKS